MDKYFMLLVSIAVFGHSATGRSWGGGGYDYYSSREKDNHQSFNYNDWCHKPGGWDWHNSWEDSWNDSNESYGWGDDRFRSTKTSSSTPSTTTSRNVAMVISNSEGRTTTEIRAASTGSTPSPIEVLLCLRLCPLTSEYNPVCGTDNITYRNPGRLECARTCGISVSIQQFMACEVTTNQPPTTTTTTTTTPQPTTTPTTTTTTGLPPSQLFFMACTRNCPSTSEYNPICGSDNITYANPSRFECAKNCGKTDLFVTRTSRCPVATDQPSQTSAPTTTTRPMTTQPTQATPTATTLSTSGTRVTRYTTIDTNPPGTAQGPNAITSGGLGFTIAQNILEGIFPLETTQPDYNVDERLGTSL